MAFSIIVPFSIHAQNLPQLQRDGAVTVGELPNGISYYLVTDATAKGFADFALVRRGMADTLSTRKELTSLPHFNKTVPYDFLSRKGIGCDKDGYISYKDSTTIFRFSDVPVYDQAASDTTLLMLFDLIAAQPFRHAIVVAGDINAGNVIAKMAVFTMMVPSRSPEYSRPEYIWKPSEEFTSSFTPSGRPSVSLEVRSSRTPAAQMNTIQPFLSSLYVTELERIVRNRISESFFSRNIPVRSLDVSYSSSADTAGDELFEVKVETTEDDLIPATMGLSSIISQLAKNGVSRAEYKTAKEAVVGDYLEPESNSTHVDRCIGAYLYGADLAAPATKVQYVTSRNVSLDSELSLFNNFIKAFLDSPDNINLKWNGSEENYDEWTYRMAFRSTWNGVAMLDNLAYPWIISEGDTLSMGTSKGKSKLKTTEPEAFSGGEVWTYANGMKVIYKKMNTGGRFNYSLMVKGGYSTIKDLKRGEGAYLSDMLWLYNIAGIPGKNFRKILQANSVEMDADVNITDTRIYGSAPSDELSLVVKALLSVANDRKRDESAFEAYRQTTLEKLKTDYVDSLMFPGYNYTGVKTRTALAPGLMDVADAYFNRQFLKVNDGVFVIAGELNVESAQKLLSHYLGGFKVSKLASSRQMLQYSQATSLTTYSSKGEDKETYIAIYAPVSYTIENNTAVEAVRMSLENALSGTMAKYGYHVSSSSDLLFFPYEAAELVFRCVPVPEYSLPSSVKGGGEYPMEALMAARKTIDSVLSSPMPAADLNAYKALVGTTWTKSYAKPGEFIDAVLMRYSNGKDILKDYSARINSVNASRVAQVSKALSEGRRIEYVVR